MHNIGQWLTMPRHGMQLSLFIASALVLGIVSIFSLTLIPHRFRKPIIVLVTFVSGLFLSLEFLIPNENVFTTMAPMVANIEIVVGCFTLLLGIWNLFAIHGKTVIKKKEGWYNSAAFFVAFFSILIIGFLKDRNIGVSSDLFGILFSGFLLSLKSTMFSLIAFYIASASYRAFRIRSTESALMMLAATIIMLALVPVGAAITNWIPKTGMISALRLENLGDWLLTSPNMAVQRAIAFGIAVGAMATSLRIWLSLERGSFFDSQL